MDVHSPVVGCALVGVIIWIIWVGFVIPVSKPTPKGPRGDDRSRRPTLANHSAGDEQRPEGYSPSGLRSLSPVRWAWGYSKRDVELSGSLLVCGV